MKIKILSSVSILALLAGCVTQQPAPISDGYGSTGSSSYILSEPTEPKAIIATRDTSTYYAKAGDTFYSISRAYNVPVAALYKRNNVSKHAVVQEGQKITVPSSSWLKSNNFDVVNSNGSTESYRLTDKYKDFSKSTKNAFETAIDAIAGGANKVSEGVSYGVNGARKLAGVPVKETKPAVDKITPKTSSKIEGERKTIKFTKNDVATKTVATTKVLPKKIHVVKSGDNIFRIGLNYGVSQFDIMAANNIDKPQALEIGQKLVIPAIGGKVETSERTVISKPAIAASKKEVIITRKPAVSADVRKVVENAKKGVKPMTTVVKTTEVKPVVKTASGRVDYAKLMKKYSNKGANARGMIWPARGKILKKFGDKGKGVNHTGIAIGLPKNAPIRAAESGTVIYADSGLKSYGNLILVKHSGGYVTAYAHNAANMVKKNKRVRKGDVIGFAGNTGNVENTQLHFEVRKNNRAVNPLGVLPR